MAAAPAGGGAAAPGSNWLSEWQARTPLVSRWAVYVILPFSLIGFLIPGFDETFSLSPDAFTRGELWRLVTALPYQGNLLALVFLLLMLVLQAPKIEESMGSARFIVQVATFGFLVNVFYCAITVRRWRWEAGAQHARTPVGLRAG